MNWVRNRSNKIQEEIQKREREWFARVKRDHQEQKLEQSRQHQQQQIGNGKNRFSTDQSISRPHDSKNLGPVKVNKVDLNKWEKEKNRSLGRVNDVRTLSPAKRFPFSSSSSRPSQSSSSSRKSCSSKTASTGDSFFPPHHTFVRQKLKNVEEETPFTKKVTFDSNPVMFSYSGGSSSSNRSTELSGKCKSKSEMISSAAASSDRTSFQYSNSYSELNKKFKEFLERKSEPESPIISKKFKTCSSSNGARMASDFNASGSRDNSTRIGGDIDGTTGKKHLEAPQNLVEIDRSSPVTRKRTEFHLEDFEDQIEFPFKKSKKTTNGTTPSIERGSNYSRVSGEKSENLQGTRRKLSLNESLFGDQDEYRSAPIRKCRSNDQDRTNSAVNLYFKPNRKCDISSDELSKSFRLETGDGLEDPPIFGIRSQESRRKRRMFFQQSSREAESHVQADEVAECQDDEWNDDDDEMDYARKNNSSSRLSEDDTLSQSSGCSEQESILCFKKSKIRNEQDVEKYNGLTSFSISSQNLHDRVIKSSVVDEIMVENNPELVKTDQQKTAEDRIFKKLLDIENDDFISTKYFDYRCPNSVSGDRNRFLRELVPPENTSLQGRHGTSANAQIGIVEKDGNSKNKPGNTDPGSKTSKMNDLVSPVLWKPWNSSVQISPTVWKPVHDAQTSPILWKPNISDMQTSPVMWINEHCSVQNSPVARKPKISDAQTSPVMWKPVHSSAQTSPAIQKAEISDVQTSPIVWKSEILKPSLINLHCKAEISSDRTSQVVWKAENSDAQILKVVKKHELIENENSSFVCKQEFPVCKPVLSGSQTEHELTNTQAKPKLSVTQTKPEVFGTPIPLVACEFDVSYTSTSPFCLNKCSDAQTGPVSIHPFTAKGSQEHNGLNHPEDRQICTFTYFSCKSESKRHIDGLDGVIMNSKVNQGDDQKIIVDQDDDQKNIVDQGDDQKIIVDQGDDQKIIVDQDDDQKIIVDQGDDQKIIVDQGDDQKIIVDQGDDQKIIVDQQIKVDRDDDQKIIVDHDDDQKFVDQQIKVDRDDDQKIILDHDDDPKIIVGQQIKVDQDDDQKIIVNEGIIINLRQSSHACSAESKGQHQISNDIKHSMSNNTKQHISNDTKHSMSNHIDCCFSDKIKIKFENLGEQLDIKTEEMGDIYNHNVENNDFGEVIEGGTRWQRNDRFQICVNKAIVKVERKEGQIFADDEIEKHQMILFSDRIKRDLENEQIVQKSRIDEAVMSSGGAPCDDTCEVAKENNSADVTDDVYYQQDMGNKFKMVSSDVYARTDIKNNIKVSECDASCLASIKSGCTKTDSIFHSCVKPDGVEIATDDVITSINTEKNFIGDVNSTNYIYEDTTGVGDLNDESDLILIKAEVVEKLKITYGNEQNCVVGVTDITNDVIYISDDENNTQEEQKFETPSRNEKGDIVKLAKFEQSLSLGNSFTSTNDCKNSSSAVLELPEDSLKLEKPGVPTSIDGEKTDFDESSQEASVYFSPMVEPASTEKSTFGNFGRNENYFMGNEC